MAERNYWVLCDDNCRFPAMTKEQTLTAIMQAVNEGRVSNVDAGFVTTIKTVNGVPLRFFVGTQSEYELLKDADREGLFAIITNDVTKEDLFRSVETLQKTLDDFMLAIGSGQTVVPRADKATRDEYGKRFVDEYLNLPSDSDVYEGNAAGGVEICCRSAYNGGSAYLATWDFNGDVHCFGVMFWSGELYMRSPIVRAANGYDYYVQIQQEMVGSDEACLGTAIVYSTNDSANSDANRGTLTLKCLTSRTTMSGN